MIGSGHAIATQRTELPVAFRCTGLVVDETKRQIVRLRRRGGPHMKIDPCDKCEEMMQPYLDGDLSVEEVAEAETHLEKCAWCAKRFT